MNGSNGKDESTKGSAQVGHTFELSQDGVESGCHCFSLEVVSATAMNKTGVTSETTK